MEEQKRGRGRPKIDTALVDAFAPSRRAAMNAKYMYDGMWLLKEAADDIPDSELLWYSDDTTHTAKGKNGILEQLGRMAEQDQLLQDDCVFFANKAIDALKAGHTSREVEKALRAIRMAIKRANGDFEDNENRYHIGHAINDLVDMG